jgi:translocator protein
MKRHIMLRAIATAAFTGMILTNALANILPINGLSTGEVAALYPSLFTPAGVTFSIWSVIYLALLGFILFGWIHRDEPTISAILPLFIASCLLNASWILAWHYLFPLLSVFIMLVLLYTLIRIFRITQKAENQMAPFFAKIPFALYLAWICMATVANISAYLSSMSWDVPLFSQEIWTVIMLVVAATLILRIFMRFRAPVMVIVLIWTLLGIFLRWRESDLRLLTYSIVVIGATVLMFALYHLRKVHRA